MYLSEFSLLLVGNEYILRGVARVLNLKKKTTILWKNYKNWVTRKKNKCLNNIVKIVKYELLIVQKKIKNYTV